jgi:hypothetical protein
MNAGNQNLQIFQVCTVMKRQWANDISEGAYYICFIEPMSILVLTFNWKLNNFFVAVTFHVYNVCCSTHIKASIYTLSPLNRIITLNDITIAFIYRVVFKRPFHLWLWVTFHFALYNCCIVLYDFITINYSQMCDSRVI